MSLVTYPNSNRSKSPGRASKNAAKRPATQAGSGAAPSFFLRLRNALAATGRLVAKVHTAIAEARMQKAIIEAELYRNRLSAIRRRMTTILPIVR